MRVLAQYHTEKVAEQAPVEQEKSPIKEGALLGITMAGSGWDEMYVEDGYVDVAPYDASAGGSYIPLPSSLAAKKAIVNVKNNDDECLRWALKSAKNGERTSRCPENDDLNWNGIEFPVKVPQICKLEKQNQGLAIKVFGLENGDLTILWISDKSKAIKRINLMLVMDGQKSHCCWIKDMGRLLNRKTKNRDEQFYCDICLSRFTKERVLKTHQELCEGVNGRPTRIEMPKKGKTRCSSKTTISSKKLHT